MSGKKEPGKNVTAKKQSTKKAIFEFQALDARDVYLAGDFNNWDIHTYPMKKDRKGAWKATLPLTSGRYEYKFFVDGCWESDPSCSCCVPNQFGSMNCVKIVE
ncbi:MAG: isoamylase early set domain-containing protein [Geobacteraceae bacterium]|nr:isoamylase early set domain-containing protein [Geobacteraceae bacterium]